MNFMANASAFCDRRPEPIAPPIVEKRRRLDGLEEGDPILVQSASGVCDQGVFIRIEDGFLIWVRSVSGKSFITITSLDSISITRL